MTNDELNKLFALSWPCHAAKNFQLLLRHSLTYLCAYRENQLIGFINVAWDGGIHAFILDGTVHPNLRRRGVGLELVRRAAEIAQKHGIGWLHVDYEVHLKTFYERCGFKSTEAGLLRLDA